MPFRALRQHKVQTFFFGFPVVIFSYICRPAHSPAGCGTSLQSAEALAVRRAAAVSGCEPAKIINVMVRVFSCPPPLVLAFLLVICLSCRKLKQRLAASGPLRVPIGGSPASKSGRDDDAATHDIAKRRCYSAHAPPLPCLRCLRHARAPRAVRHLRRRRWRRDARRSHPRDYSAHPPPLPCR